MWIWRARDLLMSVLVSLGWSAVYYLSSNVIFCMRCICMSCYVDIELMREGSVMSVFRRCLMTVATPVHSVNSVLTACIFCVLLTVHLLLLLLWVFVYRVFFYRDTSERSHPKKKPLGNWSTFLQVNTTPVTQPTVSKYLWDYLTRVILYINFMILVFMGFLQELLNRFSLFLEWGYAWLWLIILEVCPGPKTVNLLKTGDLAIFHICLLLLWVGRCSDARDLVLRRHTERESVGCGIMTQNWLTNDSWPLVICSSLKLLRIWWIITHWCSIAERAGCFQRRLFVCQHDNFRTIKRTMMKLGG